MVRKHFQNLTDSLHVSIKDLGRAFNVTSEAAEEEQIMRAIRWESGRGSLGDTATAGTYCLGLGHRPCQPVWPRSRLNANCRTA